MGKLTSLLRVYADYRSADRFAEVIKEDFPIVYAVRIRISKMLKRWGEFIKKG